MRSSLTESRPAPNTNAHVYRSWSSPIPQPSPAPPPVAKPRRKLRLVPSEGWLPLVLLAVAVYSVVYSVTAAILIDHSSVLWITTALGLLCGLLVSKSRYFSQAVLHIGACILGYWIALVLTGFLAYHVSLLDMLSSLRVVIANGFSLAGTQSSEMVFLFYLAFLCFFLGYFGSWLIYRARLPWLVALVYISIMIVNLNYIAKRDLSFLVIILVGALMLLIARVQLANQLAQWKSDGLYTDQPWLRGLTSRFLRIAALFVLLILPLGWFLPVGAQPPSGVTLWNNLDNAWANITHGNLPSLTNPGSLFSPYEPPTNFFGDQLTISGNVNLPTSPVLSYTTSSSTRGQYLESATFDYYDGHTAWTSQMTSASQPYTANASLPPDSTTANYSSLTTSVTMLQPPGGTKHFIFAPAQPSSFSVPVTLITDNTGTFIAAWTSTAPLTHNQRYQVVSEIVEATPADLSATPLPGADPSFWQGDPNYAGLQHYYLQKPAHLSPEVLATARAWTSNAGNTYAAALALQNHLNNSSFTYSVTNPPIPADEDAVTWLLHSHRGYCIHYATAMTVMARLLGIPARMVTGFSQGHYDTQQHAWIVDGSDAHSWVQIYFPGSGWINFDPTPGFSVTHATSPGASPTPSPTRPVPSSSPTAPARKHPAGSQATPAPRSGSGTAPAPAMGDLAGQNLLLGLSLLILLCSLVVLAISIRSYRASRSPRSPIASVYARLCRVAGLVGSPPASWQTPYEYTFTLSQRFPQISAALRRLADLFVRERWAAPLQAPTAGEEREVERLWPRLRNTILRAPLSKGH
jgi:hypothetical protein